MTTPRVLFLGAGDAFSSGGRHQAAYLVQGRDTTFLLDCGVTVLASLKRQCVDPASIDTVLISHLHGDHFAGIPFLLLEYIYATPRRKPLRIAGPPGTEDRVWTLFRTMYRETGSLPLPFELEFVELLPKKSWIIDDLQTDPFRVPHQEKEISLGLRVQLDGRVILYSGDTGWTEELVTQSEGADLFICECCFFETRVPTHLDYPRIAENHHRFGSRELVLTHLGREVLDRHSEIKIKTAHDGLAVDLVG